MVLETFAKKYLDKFLEPGYELNLALLGDLKLTCENVELKVAAIYELLKDLPLRVRRARVNRIVINPTIFTLNNLFSLSAQPLIVEVDGLEVELYEPAQVGKHSSDDDTDSHDGDDVDEDTSDGEEEEETAEKTKEANEEAHSTGKAETRQLATKTEKHEKIIDGITFIFTNIHVSLATQGPTKHQVPNEYSPDVLHVCISELRFEQCDKNFEVVPLGQVQDFSIEKGKFLSFRRGHVNLSVWLTRATIADGLCVDTVGDFATFNTSTYATAKKPRETRTSSRTMLLDHTKIDVTMTMEKTGSWTKDGLSAVTVFAFAFLLRDPEIEVSSRSIAHLAYTAKAIDLLAKRSKLSKSEMSDRAARHKMHETDAKKAQEKSLIATHVQFRIECPSLSVRLREDVTDSMFFDCDSSDSNNFSSHSGNTETVSRNTHAPGDVGAIRRESSSALSRSIKREVSAPVTARATTSSVLRTDSVEHTGVGLVVRAESVNIVVDLPHVNEPLVVVQATITSLSVHEEHHLVDTHGQCGMPMVETVPLILIAPQRTNTAYEVQRFSVNFSDTAIPPCTTSNASTRFTTSAGIIFAAHIQKNSVGSRTDCPTVLVGAVGDFDVSLMPKNIVTVARLVTPLIARITASLEMGERMPKSFHLNDNAYYRPLATDVSDLLMLPAAQRPILSKPTRVHVQIARAKVMLWTQSIPGRGAASVLLELDRVDAVVQWKVDEQLCSRLVRATSDDWEIVQMLLKCERVHSTTTRKTVTLSAGQGSSDDEDNSTTESAADKAPLIEEEGAASPLCGEAHTSAPKTLLTITDLDLSLHLPIADSVRGKVVLREASVYLGVNRLAVNWDVEAMLRFEMISFTTSRAVTTVKQMRLPPILASRGVAVDVLSDTVQNSIKSISSRLDFGRGIGMRPVVRKRERARAPLFAAESPVQRSNSLLQGQSGEIIFNVVPRSIELHFNSISVRGTVLPDPPSEHPRATLTHASHALLTPSLGDTVDRRDSSLNRYVELSFTDVSLFEKHFAHDQDGDVESSQTPVHETPLVDTMAMPLLSADSNATDDEEESTDDEEYRPKTPVVERLNVSGGSRRRLVRSGTSAGQTQVMGLSVNVSSSALNVYLSDGTVRVDAANRLPNHIGLRVPLFCKGDTDASGRSEPLIDNVYAELWPSAMIGLLSAPQFVLPQAHLPVVVALVQQQTQPQYRLNKADRTLYAEAMPQLAPLFASDVDVQQVLNRVPKVQTFLRFQSNRIVTLANNFSQTAVHTNDQLKRSTAILSDLTLRLYKLRMRVSPFSQQSEHASSDAALSSKSSSLADTVPPAATLAKETLAEALADPAVSSAMAAAAAAVPVPTTMAPQPHRHRLAIAYATIVACVEHESHKRGLFSKITLENCFEPGEAIVALKATNTATTTEHAISLLEKMKERGWIAPVTKSIDFADDKSVYQFITKPTAEAATVGVPEGLAEVEKALAGVRKTLDGVAHDGALVLRTSAWERSLSHEWVSAALCQTQEVVSQLHEAYESRLHVLRRENATFKEMVAATGQELTVTRGHAVSAESIAVDATESARLRIVADALVAGHTEHLDWSVLGPMVLFWGVFCVSVAIIMGM